MASDRLEARVPASKVAASIEMSVTVTGLRVMAARAWLGVKLLRLAAAVMGVGLRIETDARPRRPRQE